MNTIQKPSIWTLSPECLGPYMVTGASSSSSSTFPAANDALLVPVALDRPAFVKRLFCANGGTTSGNIDMGIYTSGGARIVSIGSTAQSGTTTLQFFDITDLVLSPGNYYLAVAMNNTTGTLRRFNVSIIREQQYGVLKATSSFALPSSITFATMTATYIPLIGMELKGVL